MLISDLKKAAPARGECRSRPQHYRNGTTVLGSRTPFEVPVDVDGDGEARTTSIASDTATAFDLVASTLGVLRDWVG